MAVETSRTRGIYFNLERVKSFRQIQDTPNNENKFIYFSDESVPDLLSRLGTSNHVSTEREMFLINVLIIVQLNLGSEVQIWFSKQVF